MTDDFVCVGEPWSAASVALVHAVLGGSGIRYFIVNEHGAQWCDGTVGLADGAMRLMVEEDRAEDARALVVKVVR